MKFPQNKWKNKSRADFTQQIFENYQNNPIIITSVYKKFLENKILKKEGLKKHEIEKFHSSEKF